jgi:heptose I phosphotransferase
VILIFQPKLKQYFSPDENLFDQIMALSGETFRALENRRTQKIVLGGKNYFLKQHFGIGWKEIFKNLFQLRLPIISAKNEWLAIQRLHTLAVPTDTIQRI